MNSQRILYASLNARNSRMMEDIVNAFKKLLKQTQVSYIALDELYVPLVQQLLYVFCSPTTEVIQDDNTITSPP